SRSALALCCVEAVNRPRDSTQAQMRNITFGATYQRAFLARRRGHGGAVEREILIRGGGLKTCWTKPPGTAVPQLWALQLGEELRGAKKTGRKGCGQEIEADAVPRRRTR
ncbi:hypothetical protein, partial [Bradyrhizobium sp. 141]|uniref:hypothetical protein n=1 Tax=Bradyrhizobium sp. 141 TaxID=2782617 RepID=UPI001FF803D1